LRGKACSVGTTPSGRVLLHRCMTIKVLAIKWERHVSPSLAGTVKPAYPPTAPTRVCLHALAPSPVQRRMRARPRDNPRYRRLPARSPARCGEARSRSRGADGEARTWPLPLASGPSTGDRASQLDSNAVLTDHANSTTMQGSAPAKFCAGAGPRAAAPNRRYNSSRGAFGDRA